MDVEEKVENFTKRNTVEVTKHGQDPSWLVEKREQDSSFLATIERLAKMPDVDPAKVKLFMDMQERILDRNAKQAFNAAMTEAQNKIEPVVNKSKNDQTHSMYSKLKAILVKAKPIYTGAGFSLMFYEGECPLENHKRVCVDIMHNEGHTEKRYGDFAIQTTGIAGKAMMTLIHGQGSTFSYGRRYLTCMIFNIPTGDDDDGNNAGKSGGDGDDFISPEQLKDLKTKVEKSKINVVAYLKHLNIETLSELPVSMFKKAQLPLDARIKQNK